MPRGVYKRMGGKAAAVEKAAAPSVVPAATPALAAPAAMPQFTATDFRKPIDDMSTPLLRAYARRIGIMQRDVDGLTEDRLRQNCKIRAIQNIEDA